ncbi:MAG TPA: TVP38/TMEM64 family protein [Caulobacteraceae bacterium]|nr:TVP38/TMEM64 family protein [Caulobacteraceae bacterium]
MRRLIAFLAKMDARAWRSLAISFLLFGGVGTLLVLGAPALGLDQGSVQRWMALAHGAWALPAAVGAFAGLAFLGAPQFVLIAAAVVVFGPWTGALYSWIGTLVSALIGFELGRLFGAGFVRGLKSERLDRFMVLVGANGFMASLIVRLVPAAPFVVVNMAAGVAAMRRRDFAAGTALGIVPKILLAAFAGGSILAAMNGAGWTQIVFVAVAAALWLGAAVLARRWLKARQDAAPQSGAAPQSPAETG